MKAPHFPYKTGMRIAFLASYCGYNAGNNILKQHVDFGRYFILAYLVGSERIMILNALSSSKELRDFYTPSNKLLMLYTQEM